MSATFREVDETMERDLFERRARVLSREALSRGAGARAEATAGVPSLESVLRAASEEASVAVPLRPRDEVRETSGARMRAWSGFALAAACVIAVLRTGPQVGAPTTIAADVAGDAGVSIASVETSAPCNHAEDNACGVDHSCASGASITPVAPIAPAAPPVPEARTCDAPVATFETSSTLSCDRDDANRSVIP